MRLSPARPSWREQPVCLGAHPWAALIRDAAGNLYGTTSEGGSGRCYISTPQRTRVYVGCGVVFKLDTKGVETILHNFAGFDGASPLGVMVRDSLVTARLPARALRNRQAFR